MPELPEVETTRCGIEPHLIGHTITTAIVRNRNLRWPIPRDLARQVRQQVIEGIERRGKYLLVRLSTGSLILHLGMSGSLRILDCSTPPDKHDHVDLVLENGQCLRLRDPRRFGALLFTRREPLHHKLLRGLGPEPLGQAFDGRYLFNTARGRKIAVKSFLMDSKVVVGIGNIYANEALFLAGIHPKRAAGRISLERYQQLAAAIRQVLRAAIRAGGTTLRDFTAENGRPGYFSQKLKVYGRTGEPCPVCGTLIRHLILGQRSTYYCPHCQH
jgi:formamidopyrimidine-DNA glycosylase